MVQATDIEQNRKTRPIRSITTDVRRHSHQLSKDTASNWVGSDS